MKMTKQNLTKFWLNYSKNLFKVNIAKFLILIAGIGFYIGGISIPKTTRFYEVERHFVDEGKHYYDLTHYRDALVYDTEQKLFQDDGDSFIKQVEWHAGAIFLMVFAYISFIIVFISCLVNDCDFNLELERVLKDTLYDNYNIVELDQNYHHISYSKIIYSKTSRSSISHLNKYVPDITLKEFFNKEDYYTKSELRDIKLNKIGI